MNLVDSLRQNFEAVVAAAPYRAPQNLLELRGQLRDACQRRNIPQDLAHYCNWYSQHLAKIHTQENQSMSRTRGQARRLWAEQSLIYLDLIRLLKDLSLELHGSLWTQLEQATDELFELVDEFTDALQEMQEWTVSEQTRCLKCGWNGTTGHCPHCKVQVLKPIRDYATHVNHYVTLAPAQGAIFKVMMAVLEGTRDVSALQYPLQQLQKRYSETLDYLQSNDNLEIARTGMGNIEQGLAGVMQMQRVFIDNDAQHLEDGWALIFQADRENIALVENLTSSSVAVAAAYDIIRDSISMTNE
jgi:predicted Zn-ribbon and HTH transcriptional regulator